jgi:hypothetical protein
MNISGMTWHYRKNVKVNARKEIYLNFMQQWQFLTIWKGDETWVPSPVAADELPHNAESCGRQLYKLKN